MRSSWIGRSRRSNTSSEQCSLAAPVVGQHAEVGIRERRDGANLRAFVAVHAEEAFCGDEETRVRDLACGGSLDLLGLCAVVVSERSRSRSRHCIQGSTAERFIEMRARRL